MRFPRTKPVSGFNNIHAKTVIIVIVVAGPQEADAPVCSSPRIEILVHVKLALLNEDGAELQ